MADVYKLGLCTLSKHSHSIAGASMYVDWCVPTPHVARVHASVGGGHFTLMRAATANVI